MINAANSSNFIHILLYNTYTSHAFRVKTCSGSGVRDLSRVGGSAWLLLIKSVCTREGVHEHNFINSAYSCVTEQLFIIQCMCDINCIILYIM